MNTYGYP
jgi:hypothetical protein